MEDLIAPTLNDAPPAEDARAEEMLDALVAEHQAGLLRYAARYLNDAAAAQDVVQEVFIRFCRSWTPAACPRNRLHFWLYSLTHNVAVDHIRRENRRRRLHQDHLDVQSIRGTGETAEIERRRRLVLENMHRLSPAERQVLILRLQEGFSYQEISQITNRTEGNIGCLLHNATKKLSEALKQQGVAP